MSDFDFEVLNGLQPLDGKTVLNSPKLVELITNVYNEIRNTTERSYQILWSRHKTKIYDKMSEILLPNHPNISKSDLIDILKKQVQPDTAKAGRPKRKNLHFPLPVKTITLE